MLSSFEIILMRKIKLVDLRHCILAVMWLSLGTVSAPSLAGSAG